MKALGGGRQPNVAILQKGTSNGVFFSVRFIFFAGDSILGGGELIRFLYK